MKLLELYEEINNELTFQHFSDEDMVTISGFIGKTDVGSVIIEFVVSGYYMFDDTLDEDEYYEIFPDDRFAKIEHLSINNSFKGKGYARPLVEEALKYIKSMGENRVYLNASPMGRGGLNLNELVNFYKSFGFKTIPQTEKWSENKEMILTL